MGPRSFLLNEWQTSTQHEQTNTQQEHGDSSREQANEPAHNTSDKDITPMKTQATAQQQQQQQQQQHLHDCVTVGNDAPPITTHEDDPQQATRYILSGSLVP